LTRKFAAIIGVAVLLLALVGCGGGSSGEGQAPAEEEPEVLRVGLIPNQNPESVEANYVPFGEYLSEQIGREVELTVPVSYGAVVEAMINDELDLAYFGGLTYVQARERGDVVPLVTEINPETGDTTYRSVIIVPADSDVQEVSELEGRDFAFGSVSSTSGSLYPAIMLRDAGIDYRTDLGNFNYTNGHDATAQAVANGQVDGGGLEDRILYRLQRDGVIDADSVRVIDESDEIQGYPWVIRNALPDDLKQEVAQAFLDIDDPALLDLLRAEGYERIEAGDYDYVQEQATELELLTER
jgi:phosphonate transport system substrate-binding protein